MWAKSAIMVQQLWGCRQILTPHAFHATDLHKREAGTARPYMVEEIDLNTWMEGQKKTPVLAFVEYKLRNTVVRTILSRALQEQMTYQYHLNLRPSSDHAKNFRQCAWRPSSSSRGLFPGEVLFIRDGILNFLNRHNIWGGGVTWTIFNADVKKQFPINVWVESESGLLLRRSTSLTTYLLFGHILLELLDKVPSTWHSTIHVVRAWYRAPALFRYFARHYLKDHLGGQSSWLQIQRSGFDSRLYQIFWAVVGLEEVHSASWLQLRSSK
jgi:hypothetical protein